jgi:ribosomal protein L29
MELNELRNKTVEELNEQTKSLKKEVSEVMNTVLKGKEKNFKKATKLRRDIARVLTVLKEKTNA